MDEPPAKFFADNNLTPPSRESHDATADNIREKLVPMKPRNWRQQGNQLIADTDWGELVNPLPYGVILTGTDERGLPTFKKI